MSARETVNYFQLDFTEYVDYFKKQVFDKIMSDYTLVSSANFEKLWFDLNGRNIKFGDSDGYVLVTLIPHLHVTNFDMVIRYCYSYAESVKIMSAVNYLEKLQCQHRYEITRVGRVNSCQLNFVDKKLIVRFSELNEIIRGILYLLAKPEKSLFDTFIDDKIIKNEINADDIKYITKKITIDHYHDTTFNVNYELFEWSFDYDVNNAKFLDKLNHGVGSDASLFQSYCDHENKRDWVGINGMLKITKFLHPIKYANKDNGAMAFDLSFIGVSLCRIEVREKTISVATSETIIHDIKNADKVISILEKYLGNYLNFLKYIHKVSKLHYQKNVIAISTDNNVHSVRVIDHTNSENFCLIELSDNYEMAVVEALNTQFKEFKLCGSGTKSAPKYV